MNNPPIVTYEWMKKINAPVVNTAMMRFATCDKDYSMLKSNFATPKLRGMQ